MTIPICIPDLSTRAFALTVERTMPIPANVLFRAWTEQFDFMVRLTRVGYDEK